MELSLRWLSAALRMRPAGQPHRTIVVSQYQELLQQRRRERQSAQFKERMHERNAIEGTVSELARGHGLRRSRYHGLAQVELQNLLVATGCNIKRSLRAIAQSFSSSAHALFVSPRLVSMNRSRFSTNCFLCHQSAATPSI